MDSKVFWLVMAVAFAMVIFICFLTNNSVWDQQRTELESFRTATDDARDGRAPIRPVVASVPRAQQPAPIVAPQPEPKVEPTAVAVDAAKPVVAATEKPTTEKMQDEPEEQYSAIDEFFHDYEEALGTINDEEDPEKQEELCRAITKRLDDKLRNQTWEFNCVVQKIEAQPEHMFNISHQAPDELDLVPDGWTVLDKAVSLPLLQLANKQQVFKGDYIVYVGTPRFDTVLADPESGNRRGEYSNLEAVKRVQPLSTKQIADAKYFYCTIEIGGIPYTQTLHLQNANVKFIKGSENLARANWLEQQKNMPQQPRQMNIPQQQTLAQVAPYGGSGVNGGGGNEIFNQTNNYYSSTHRYYAHPEWIAFYRVHHFHHAHEHEPDYARLALPTNGLSTANAVKVQAAKPTPQPQRTSAAVAVKPPPKVPATKLQPKK